MELLSTSYFTLLLWLSFIVDRSEVIADQSKNELKHVHVIFSHKLYAPLEPNTSYRIPEKLDYEHFLTNTTEMPNEAKLEMFNLGVYLRERYDKFLGDIYYTEVLKMRTSENFLSMISGQLVNAGLWPPSEEQKWMDGLEWQPVVTENEPMESDVLFLGTLCPHFLDEENHLLATDESIKNEVSAHKLLFNHISSHYGKKIEQPSDISLLYSSLETIASDKSPNGTLPSWANGIFPDGEMLNVTLLSYKSLSKTEVQRQLNGGVFLKKIINETMRLIGINDTFDPYMNMSLDAKISMYSGEERNLIGTLQAMNLWDYSHLPQNGASLILELRYDRSNEQYGFEIYYYTGVADNLTMGLTLPGCESFCPLSNFTRIVDDALPNDEEILCHTRRLIFNSANDNQHHYFLHFITLSIVFLSLLSPY